MTRYLLAVQADALRDGDLDTLKGACDGAIWVYSAGPSEAARRRAMAAWPEGMHVARPYPAPWPDIDLSGFAAVILGNEPDAPDEADRDPVAESYAAKVQARHQAIRRRYPTLATIAPALSPGVTGWEDYLARLVAAGAYGAVGVAGAHRYAGTDTVPAYRARLPGLPVWVTEQGWAAPGDPLWRAGDVPVICLFAARWQGHAADGYDLLERPDVLARLRAIKQTAARDGPPLRQDAPQGPGGPPAVGVGKGKPPVTDYAKATWVPSPNYWGGRQGQKVTAIVLHGTAGPGAVSWFENPASQVSAHYVVASDGSVVQCVAEDDAAWHAGVVTPDSAYAGGPNPNLTTIGIEHVRDTGNTSPITAEQLAASLGLVRDICRRRGKLALLLHNQLDVGRICPGPGFPLAAFQQAVGGGAAPSEPSEAEAWSYYTQLGRAVSREHAIWTVALLPLWQDYRAAPAGLADLRKPGPLAGPEVGSTWGTERRPAATVRLTNRIVGVYLAADGGWRPYQAELP